jgi:hypothetical protein
MKNKRNEIENIIDRALSRTLMIRASFEAKCKCAKIQFKLIKAYGQYWK